MMNTGDAIAVKPDKIKIDLHNVHETLLLPLWSRAKAAELNPPALNDVWAESLVNRLDYDFTRFNTGVHGIHILILAIRAKEMDGIIRQFITRHPRASIVNIGAGLDTTFYRVNNGKIKWYDLDVPDVINLRRSLLEPSSQIHSISKSMFDPTFLDSISQPDDGILFLVSGVLMYFQEKEVRMFLETLTSRFPCGEIAFDSMTPFGMHVANRLIPKFGITGAEMHWSISDTRQMGDWGIGLELLEHYPICAHTPPPASWGILNALLLHISNIFPAITLNHMQFSKSITSG